MASRAGDITILTRLQMQAARPGEDWQAWLAQRARRGWARGARWLFLAALGCVGLTVLMGFIGAFVAGGVLLFLITPFLLLLSGTLWLQCKLEDRQRARRYRPRRSFTKFRKSDVQITRRYKLMMWGSLVGAGLCPVLFWVSTERVRPAFLLVCLLGTALIGYYGAIAKKVHADIDPISVDMLRSAGLIGREKVYSAFRNFDSPTDPARKSFAILAVLADGIVLIFHDGEKWSPMKRRFTDLRAIGCERDAGEGVHVGLGFADGFRFALTLSDAEHLTTEPNTFARQLLQSIDDFLLGVARAPEHRRRRVTTAQSESPSAPIASGRALDIEASPYTNPDPPLSGRVLELSF